MVGKLPEGRMEIKLEERRPVGAILAGGGVGRNQHADRQWVACACPMQGVGGLRMLFSGRERMG